ncbi:MAG TPA: class D sortase [Firmicutes bacterium]|nr:class D sortase [Bacillota bacterium]
MRRLMAVVLIIAGLGLLAYPTARERYYDYRQQQLLKAWAESLAEAASPDAPVESPVESPESSPDDRPDPALEKYVQENMIGVLRIARIGLEMPVLKRDTASNLDISVAHLANSAGPGETGNFCIAGHRQLTYGRHFNRLHEVSKGDLVEFTGPEETFIYKVFEARVIQPEETSVLEPSGVEKLITLVTCHGTRRPFTRFVVRGRLVEEGES